MFKYFINVLMMISNFKKIINKILALNCHFFYTTTIAWNWIWTCKCAQDIVISKNDDDK